MARKRPSRLTPVVRRDGNKTITETGIYQQIVELKELKTAATITVNGKSFPAATHQTVAEMREASDAWNAEPHRTINAMRTAAASIFNEYAVAVADISNPPLSTTMLRRDAGDGARIYQLPDDAPPAASDAAEVLLYAELAQDATTAQQYQQYYAIQLGRVYERMRVRKAEPRALAGMKQAARNAKIAKQRRVSEAELKRRYTAVQDALAAQAKQGKRISRERAYKTAAKRLKLSQIAVKKAFLAIDRVEGGQKLGHFGVQKRASGAVAGRGVRGTECYFLVDVLYAGSFADWSCLARWAR